MTDPRQHSTVALDPSALPRSALRAVRRPRVVALAIFAVVIIGTLVIGRGEPPAPILPADVAMDRSQELSRRDAAADIGLGLDHDPVHH